MPRMVASRNLRICTKDCMCLYVCPTGATDTETGQVDFSKCVGCGDCARSCPNSAISMIPLDYPHQQPKDERVKEKVRAIARSKAAQENIAKQIAESADDPGLRILMTSGRPATSSRRAARSEGCWSPSSPIRRRDSRWRPRRSCCPG